MDQTERIARMMHESGDELDRQNGHIGRIGWDDLSGSRQKQYRHVAGKVIEALMPADDETWLEFVDQQSNLCGLCGNRGVIDTRGKVRSPTGTVTGVLAHCICPNGRSWKAKGIDPAVWGSDQPAPPPSSLVSLPSGMELLPDPWDQFAAAALTGILGRGPLVNPAAIADQVARFADALLAERAKRRGKVK